MRSAPFTLAVLFLAGCGVNPSVEKCQSQFSVWDARVSASLVVDTSTEAQVRSLLGSPAVSGLRGDTTGSSEMKFNILENGSTGAYCGTYVTVIRSNGKMSCIAGWRQYQPITAHKSTRPVEPFDHDLYCDSL